MESNCKAKQNYQSSVTQTGSRAKVKLGMTNSVSQWIPDKLTMLFNK